VSSVDILPRWLASFQRYGNQAMSPVADLDRTDFFLILGANPVVTNGSLMTAPGFGRRLKELRQRRAVRLCPSVWLERVAECTGNWIQ
jgi:anaerobic selenocysteine-containing dehydrogenase